MTAAAILIALLASANQAARAARVPGTGEGETLGVDPYVSTFQAEMTDIKAQLVAMQAAIMAVPIPPASVSGGMAAMTKIAATYGAMGALMTRTEAAHDTMLAHILGDTMGPVHFGSVKADPKFDEKKDDATLKPENDPTLRRSELAADRVTDAVASAPKRAAAPRPALKTMTSAFSYNSTAGGVGAGFGAPMSSPGPNFNTAVPHEAAYAPAPPAAAPGTTAGGWSGGAIVMGSGTSDSGAGAGGSSAGSSPALGGAGGSADFKPAANPGADTLTHNKSDVAQKAFERMKEKEKEAQDRIDQQRQQEQQQRQQMMQMMMQGLQSAMSAVGQAAKGASQANDSQSGQAQQSIDAGAATGGA